MRTSLVPWLLAAVLGARPGFTQEHSHADHGSHEATTTDPATTDVAFAGGSGTSRLPGADEPMQGLHFTAGEWMLMAHGYVSPQYTDASGPRGDDKLYATSMAMLTGARRTDWGRIELKSMLSLEPAMSAWGYPNLFATGETAGGEALVDRQHPHDLFMELAGRFDLNVASGTTAYLYAGLVGEPALGPSAFMHRGSAANNPEPPIAHHWFDSTHITYGVVTAGISAPIWQLEASAFRGEEPDEDRWDIEAPKLDSWSVRATLNPTRHWAIQASYGELNQPEAMHPGQDERRLTASAHYAGRRIAAMLAFSSRDRVPGDSLPAWIGEINWNLGGNNALFGRLENTLNDELFPDHDDPLHDRAFRVSKLQLGYARRIPLSKLFSLTLGASGSVYDKPAELDAAYGNDPFQYTLFARFQLGR